MDPTQHGQGGRKTLVMGAIPRGHDLLLCTNYSPLPLWLSANPCTLRLVIPRRDSTERRTLTPANPESPRCGYINDQTVTAAFSGHTRTPGLVHCSCVCVYVEVLCGYLQWLHVCGVWSCWFVGLVCVLLCKISMF